MWNTASFCCHEKNARGNNFTPNMEVTKENFETVLSTFPEVLRNAQFIAFDTEFTGLKVEGASSINYFDTLEDLYVKDRLRAETFMAIQIGFAVFFYDEEKNKYSHLGYNFYVYPSSHLDVNFTCQSKSIQFLTEHGFDFNKVFKYGIPYLRDEEVGKLLDKVKERFERNNVPEIVTKIEIPSEHKATVSSIINKIQDVLNSNDKTSFVTKRFNSFVRRLIYNSVQSEFGSRVFLESNNNDSMTVHIGFSNEEIKEKQNEKFLLKKKEILDASGFTKLIKLLIESKKLLVGHNLLLDLLFIIKQFLAPLPDSYSEFKELAKFLFPSIIDTKYVAAAEMKDVKETSLHFLVDFFENSKSMPEVLVHEGGIGHKIEDNKPHEASFDAYLTGLCFLAMAEHLGKPNIASTFFKNLPESSFLKPFLNKLATPRLCDIFYMNLGGSDNEPDRLGVYHLTFPKEWTRDNIMNLFKNCGFINIAWINSTSAFIKVKKECIGEVEKILQRPNQNYKLLSHSDFRSLNCKSDSLLFNPALNDKPESNLNNSKSSNSTPISTTSNDFSKKRKVEEDIGEVIERPQKKRCST